MHLGVGYTIVAGPIMAMWRLSSFRYGSKIWKSLGSPLLGRLSEASSVINSIAARRVAPSVKPGAALALPDQQLISFFFFL